MEGFSKHMIDTTWTKKVSRSEIVVLVAEKYIPPLLIVIYVGPVGPCT